MTDAQVRNKSTSTTYDAGFDDAEDVMASPAARTDTVDFFDRFNTGKGNTVQTVLNQKCISCHGSTNPGGPAGGLLLENLAIDLLPPVDGADDMTTVYEALTSGSRYLTADGGFRDYVTDDGSRHSPLMWVMYNHQLDDTDNSEFRSLAYDHTQLWTRDQYNVMNPFLPENRDLLTIIEWIDAGTQFSNSVSE
jgi:hypothetical protein